MWNALHKSNEGLFIGAPVRNMFSYACENKMNNEEEKQNKWYHKYSQCISLFSTTKNKCDTSAYTHAHTHTVREMSATLIVN